MQLMHINTLKHKHTHAIFPCEHTLTVADTRTLKQTTKYTSTLHTHTHLHDHTSTRTHTHAHADKKAHTCCKMTQCFRKELASYIAQANKQCQAEFSLQTHRTACLHRSPFSTCAKARSLNVLNPRETSCPPPHAECGMRRAKRLRQAFRERPNQPQNAATTRCVCKEVTTTRRVKRRRQAQTFSRHEMASSSR